MRNKSRLDRVFAQLLQHHPYGWALYKKATTREVHPGCCGYFDTDGDWHTLVDLTSSDEDLTQKGWKSPSDSFKSRDEEPQTLIWGPKTSKTVVSRQLGGEVGAPLVMAPIEPSVNMSFTCEGNEGAVLTTESPVLRYRIGDESAARQWVTDNEPEILRQYKPIVERHGIWVVTKTYTSRRCGVAVMSSKSSKVEISIGVSAPGLFSLEPTSSWKSSNEHLAHEIHDDDKGVVVFISGIYFAKKLFSSKLKHLPDQEGQQNKIFRGGYEESDGGNESEYGEEEYGQENGQENGQKEYGQDEDEDDEDEKFEKQYFNCPGP
ncbi:hypothetical protein AUP68_03806 [Ilyonectria robusta]